MTDVIFKYPLAWVRVVEVALPVAMKPLRLAMQGSVVTLWAAVDTKTPLQLRKITRVPTGGEVPENSVYPGTVDIDWTVWHYFLENLE